MIARTISQVKPCGPLAATSPKVSRPTKAQTVKKSRSKRRSDFCSLLLSSSARVVVSSRSDMGCETVPRTRMKVLGASRLTPEEVEEAELALGVPADRRAEPHAQRIVEAHEAPRAQRVARGEIAVGHDQRADGGPRGRRGHERDAGFGAQRGDRRARAPGRGDRPARH